MCERLFCQVALMRGICWQARVILVLLYIDLALGAAEHLVRRWG